MRAEPPANPDLRRQLRERLLALSPRAFEYFAGELLTYVGLQHVAVTRYRGDGGIDARGELIAESGFVRVSAGVQVKRLRQNVGRPDIDRFIGALSGQFQHGVFITTAGYAAQARAKAQASPLLRVDVIDGDQVAALMGQHRLGLLPPADGAPRLDEDFFLDFEARAVGPARLAEAPEGYRVGDAPEIARPEDDLISLRALGFALRVDPYTALDWVRAGRLRPDQVVAVGQRESYLFRRDRVGAIRLQLGLGDLPASGAEWRQAFLDFGRGRNLTRSYKPVLMLALLELADRGGAARLDDVARAFHAFYLGRQRTGLPTEPDGPLHDPARASLAQVRRLIVRHPLERFMLQHFVEYDAAAGLVRLTPQLWQELRAYDLLDLRAGAEDQLRHYYSR